MTPPPLQEVMASPRAPVLEDATRAALQNKEINILVIGCYHVGKSTLINTLFFGGEEKAPEGRSMKPCTSEVDRYPTPVDGITFNVYDSPGLQDGTGGDRSYILEMAKKCPTLSLLIYCTKLGDPIRQYEKEALGNLASAFGGDVWEKFVIALTFANQVCPPRRVEDCADYFSSVVTKKTNDLRDCFKALGKEQLFDTQIANRIFPVGSEENADLPTVQNWQGKFLNHCLDCCRTEDRSGLVRILWQYKHYVAVAIGVAGVGAATGGAVYVGSAALAATSKVVVAAATGKVAAAAVAVGKIAAAAGTAKVAALGTAVGSGATLVYSYFKRPAASQPAASQPAASQPATRQPATRQPATRQPATRQPAASQPAARQPATRQPATRQPATRQPTARQDKEKSE